MRVYITAITNYKYLKGVKILSKSLARTHTQIKLYVMIPKGNEKLKKELEAVKLNVIECETVKKSL